MTVKMTRAKRIHFPAAGIRTSGVKRKNGSACFGREARFLRTASDARFRDAFPVLPVPVLFAEPLTGAPVLFLFEEPVPGRPVLVLLAESDPGVPALLLLAESEPGIPALFLLAEAEPGIPVLFLFAEEALRGASALIPASVLFPAEAASRFEAAGFVLSLRRLSVRRDAPASGVLLRRTSFRICPELRVLLGIS